MSRRARWAVVALGVAVLLALPSAVSALPVHTPTTSTEELLSRVRASGSAGWSGYAESRGALQVPDVPELGDLAQLVGGTTRTRTWWRSPQDVRIDVLSLVGETDTVTDYAGSWTWDSADHRADRVLGDVPVHLPRPEDLLAPVLGRRLAGTRDVQVSRLPARRVAGQEADGLRLRPKHPRGTTLSAVDLWVEPRTGLPLRVEVRAVGQAAPVLTSLLLDLDLSRPAAAATAFVPPLTATVSEQRAPDLAALIDRLAPFRLPDHLAGLPRTAPVQGLSGGGVAAYGQGLGAFVVVPLPYGTGRSLTRKLEALGRRVSTPLFNGLVVEGDHRHYLIAGTVPAMVLDRAAADLTADPPPRTGP